MSFDAMAALAGTDLVVEPEDSALRKTGVLKKGTAFWISADAGELVGGEGRYAFFDQEDLDRFKAFMAKAAEA